jgi:hypothetical protein
MPEGKPCEKPRQKVFKAALQAVRVNCLESSLEQVMSELLVSMTV